MVFPVLMLVVVSIALSYPLCKAVIAVSHRVGALDRAGSEPHKPAGRRVPNTGGVAIVWGVVLPILILLSGVWLVPASVWESLLPAAAEHVAGAKSRSGFALVLLLAVGLMHGLGLADDRRGLGPWVKLAVMAGAALGLVTLGQTRLLVMLDTQVAGGAAVSTAITVLWIIVVMNAFNFLDNMDGLSGGVAAVVSAIYLAATLISGQYFVAALCALLLGALLAFMRFNIAPAKVFMGDGGSLVVGFLVAVISIRTTYIDPASGADTPGGLGSAWYGAVMPLMILAVPLYDFVSVTLLRLSQGRSPLSGDHQHFSHRLVRKGLSPRAAVAVIWLCTLATGLSGVMLGSLNTWQALLAAGQTLAILVLLAVLEWKVGPSAEHEA